VNQAQSNATVGDIVLFSPACASFDMFRNFEHRGEELKTYPAFNTLTIQKEPTLAQPKLRLMD